MQLVDGITCLYGPSASGKTNLCLFIASRSKGKIIFIDTENTFSADRIREFNKDADLDNIYLLKADSFEKQDRIIRELELLKKVDLVIIDSLTKFYRKEIQEKSNPDLVGQFKVLRRLYKEKGCKVLVTSQVYSTQDGKVLPLGGKPLRDFSRQLIQLGQEKDRFFRIEKPEGKEMPFRITTSDIKFL